MSIHLCNTNFEWELSSEFKEGFDQIPLFVQLQYLPLVYGEIGDALLTTAKTEETTRLPLYTLEEDPPYKRLETWGHSRWAKTWADKKGIAYEIPPWEVVKKVNSKEYSFLQSPLPGARLLYDGDPIDATHLLKSCFGTAGRGSVLASSKKAGAFCKREWDRGLPILSEPIVERTLDFSTQWEIESGGSITFIGVTKCHTSPTGVHVANRVGDPAFERSYQSVIDEQKAAAKNVLEEMSKLGYFGNVGFDAMLHSNHQLQPIVEINARKTMGWVALKMLRDRPLTVSYKTTDSAGLLPQKIGTLFFRKQLVSAS